MEKYLEQIVRRDGDTRQILIKLAIAIGAGLVILALSFFMVFGIYVAFIAIGVLLVANVAVRAVNMEYEYLFTEGQLSIDRIRGRSNRKNVDTFQASKFEQFAPVEEPLEALRKKYSCVKTFDFTSSAKAQGRYFAVTHTEKTDGRALVVIEPNEMILNAIRAELPKW